MEMYPECDTLERRQIGRLDMSKTGYITARVEPKLKASAARVLSKVGVSTSDAITMFLRQVVLRGGLPFEVRVPKPETKKAIEELEAGGGETFHGGTKEVFDEVLGKGKKRKA
jgi:DNA-damage-inducible protein J